MAERQHLTDPRRILNRQQIMAENWIFKDLVRAIPSIDAAIQFCAERRLLANMNNCQQCNQPRNVIRDASRKADGIVWRCPGCHSKTSIRNGSFFDHSHLSLEQILLFSYGWSRDWQFKDCTS